MFPLSTDIGAYVGHGQVARIPAVITAGAGNDGVEVSGPWFDVAALVQRPLSVVAIIIYSAVLAQAATLTIAANLQDATDDQGAGAADFGDAFASAVVATGDTGGSTEQGAVLLKANLAGHRGAIRLQSTADLSAAMTDTVAIAAAFLFGGFDDLPPADTRN